MIMVSEQRTQLLGHPLCMALVRNKWNSLGRYVYYGQLILYLLFVGLLTNFVLDTPAPYRVVQLNLTTKCYDIVCMRTLTCNMFMCKIDLSFPFSPHQIMAKADKPMSSREGSDLSAMLRKFMSEGNWTEQACLAVENLFPPDALLRDTNVLFDKWLIIVLCFVFLVKEIFQIFQVCEIAVLKRNLKAQ